MLSLFNTKANNQLPIGSWGLVSSSRRYAWLPFKAGCQNASHQSDWAQHRTTVLTFTFEGSFGAKPGQCIMGVAPGVDEVPLCFADDDGRK